MRFNFYGVFGRAVIGMVLVLISYSSFAAGDPTTEEIQSYFLSIRGDARVQGSVDFNSVKRQLLKAKENLDLANLNLGALREKISVLEFQVLKRAWGKRLYPAIGNMLREKYGPVLKFMKDVARLHAETGQYPRGKFPSDEETRAVYSVSMISKLQGLYEEEFNQERLILKEKKSFKNALSTFQYAVTEILKRNDPRDFNLSVKETIANRTESVKKVVERNAGRLKKRERRFKI